MSNQQKIDEAISTLEQAMQALKDLGFLVEEEEE